MATTGRFGFGSVRTLVWSTIMALLSPIRFVLRAMSVRRDLNQLAALDDRELKDIGLLRSDVAGAMAQPFHRDASKVLLVRSVGHRARSRALALAAERRTAFPDLARARARA